MEGKRTDVKSAKLASIKAALVRANVSNVKLAPLQLTLDRQLVHLVGEGLTSTPQEQQLVGAVELKGFGRPVRLCRLCKLEVKRNGLKSKERRQQALVIVLKDGICQRVDAKSASRVPLVQAQGS